MTSKSCSPWRAGELLALSIVTNAAIPSIVTKKRVRRIQVPRLRAAEMSSRCAIGRKDILRRGKGRSETDASADLPSLHSIGRQTADDGRMDGVGLDGGDAGGMADDIEPFAARPPDGFVRRTPEQDAAKPDGGGEMADSGIVPDEERG